MYVAPIMIFISWKTGNNLWAYLALGITSLGVLWRTADEQKKLVEAKQQSATGLEELLKAFRARNN